MRAVLVAWGIASLATGAANVAEIFLAKHTFSAGDLGYGLLYGAMGAGLVLGSLFSAAVLARSGVARTYGASLTLMAMGYVGAASSPNVWVAAVCVLVLRRRERGGHRLQRAARPARHLRPDARPGAHIRDEHHVRPRRRRQRSRRAAPRPRMSPRWIWGACGGAAAGRRARGLAARAQPRGRAARGGRGAGRDHACRSRPLESARCRAAATGRVRTLPPASGTATGAPSPARSRWSRTATRSRTASSPTSTRRPAPRTRSASPARPESGSRASSRR